MTMLVEPWVSPAGTRPLPEQLPRPIGHGRIRNLQSLSEALAAELRAHTHTEGANAGLWPNSVVHRLGRPMTLRVSGIRGASVCVITRAPRARVRIGGRQLSARASYALIDGGHRLDCDVMAASGQHPVIVLVLDLQSHVIRAVTAGTPAAVAPRREPVVSDLDDELADIVIRFLRALWAPDDRRIVAPLHLTELVYRLTRREQRRPPPERASPPTAPDPMEAVVEYICRNLSEPLTVSALAAQVCLSPSAFSRAFRDFIGQAPYQFVKAMRMERARSLLDEGDLGVGDVARAVGYTSVSHFIREFRSRFGMTPGMVRPSP